MKSSPVPRQRPRRQGCGVGRVGVVTALLCLPVCTAAIAQPAGSGSAGDGHRVGGRTAPIDAGRAQAQAPAGFEGRVAAYLLAADAQVGGLLFDDGRQVRVPPHLGPSLAALVRPGQRARVGARESGGAPGPGRMPTITAVDTGRTLSDATPAGAEPPPPVAAGPRTALAPFKVSGVVTQMLSGQRGETNGLVLDNGTQVAFPPHVAAEAGAWLLPGAAVEVEGFGRHSVYGAVVQATVIGKAGGSAVTVYGAGRRKP